MNALHCTLVAMVTVGAGAVPTAPKAHHYTLPSGLEVTIVEAPLEKNRFKVTGCTSDAGPCRINGRVPFGHTSGVPLTYVSRIAVKWKGKTHVLDSSDMYDAWGTRPLQYPSGVRYLGGSCTDELNCQIRGIFSDASASFVAEWKVIAGRPVRTVITNSADIVSLFISSIDPPVYE
jgi:hypothetical protein